MRIQPDFSVLNPDGSVHEIYDFKFDREGYQDTFSESQKRLYQDVTCKPPIVISDASCNCAARSVS